MANLSRSDSISAGDLIVTWSGTNWDYRGVPLSVFTSYLESQGFISQLLTTQYASPTATGWSVSVNTANTRLIITPQAGYAAGTIVLPTGALDQQTVVVTCTQQVTTLTITPGSGDTVSGAPTSLGAGAYFTISYDSVTHTWYRIS